MADTETKTTETETEVTSTGVATDKTKTSETNGTKATEPKVDVDKVKSDAREEFLKSLGFDDEEGFKGFVSKAKKEEDAKKSDMEKKDEVLTATTKELVQTKERAMIAEAKVSAMQLGAKPDLVEDLVVIAKSRVTKDKGIEAVIAEIKDSATGNVYFLTDDEKVNDEKTSKTVTSKRPTRQTGNEEKKKTAEKKDNENKYEGSMAARLLANRGTVKKESSFFK